jgi:hypothetical protein
MNLNLPFGFRCAVFALYVVALQPALPAQAPTAPVQKESLPQVPFVGCKSDGQEGALDAPTGTGRAVNVSPEQAQQLAYYKAEYGAGVLAPRGWNCFATYGSSGSNLYVSPQSIDVKNILSDRWKGFSGPAIQLTIEDGGTSGRFAIARSIARVFPAHIEFAQKVIKEGNQPASSFPSGPFPTDKLTYKSKEIVEFETPANSDGLGTESALKKNADPIVGALVLSNLSGDVDLSRVTLRLPASLAQLSSAILQAVETDAASPGN